MNKSGIAEWILSQVLPPDRAASTVGDWLEDKPKRGNVWFWSCVFRAVLSRVWTDFAESPGFMLSLALRSCLFAWLVYAIGTIVLIRVHAALSFPGELAGWTSCVSYGLITAQWTARRAFGSKMAACIACSFVHLILSGAIRLGSSQFLNSDLKRSLATHAARTPWIVAELIFETAFTLGFLWWRRPLRSVAQ